jgi:hypothetical protein
VGTFKLAYSVSVNVFWTGQCGHWLELVCSGRWKIIQTISTGL